MRHTPDAMAKPDWITLDCAGTLVRVQWSPGPFAMDCLEAVGVDVDRGEGMAVYERLLGTRWRDYQELNKTRDAEACVGWWRELTKDWLERMGLPAGHADALMAVADARLYDPAHGYFTLYDDTLPALELLRSEGFRLAVISNWDYSLHRVLASLGLTSYFEHVFASLEEGVEKPEAELFHIALRACGTEPSQTLHVGDDPVDDLQGASGVGMRALLIDRETAGDSPHVIGSLTQIVEKARG